MYPDGGEALMADVEFSHGMGAYGRDADDRATEPQTAQSLTTMTNIAGAFVSLALIAGVGVWGYKLMVRDVTGIPIVRAAEGEMRVRPEDPGGVLAQHQGLAVNEIAANGLAAGPVDQVRLAPAGIDLAVEDQPVAVTPIVAPAPLPPADEADTGNAVENLRERVQQGEIDEVVASLMAGSEPMVDVSGAKVVGARPAAADAGVETLPAPAVLRTETAEPEVLTGLQTSVRPRLRPAGIRSVVRPAALVVPEESPEIDAAQIPAGTRLAQLGAFDSPDVARSEWARMQSRFGEILQGKSRVVQEANSGGRTFYRLRAMGFVDLNDTRRFCSAVKAEGVDCIPVQVR